MPDCRKLLVVDETETDDPALIGEMAHMVAESVDGPRGVSPLTPAERDLYGNLLLLCRNHHREIDEQPLHWTVERLQILKADHEAWVGSNPNYDAQKVRDDITYAGYVDEWLNLCHMHRWREWSSFVLSSGQPGLEKSVRDDLTTVVSWTVKRVWPRRYPELESALQNFAVVARDFIGKFNEHCETSRIDDDELITKKFYQIDEWNEERYHRLFDRYEFHVDLVEDLMLELTRAANHVCDEIRNNLLHSFGLQEGRLSVMSGPHSDMCWRESVVQYSKAEKAGAPPYPGLQAFLTARADRDMNFGSGSEPA
ncbi:hypothetical protein FZ934_24915 (plasmid) [Rhizobium grahamii]|uniref:HNH endonuclease n=1 Tax=Rhizobium grahamii TaxID=1120045 RepID=A0A5Q0CDQ7_9HYPH|nr:MULTISPECIES: hypothetical protein [Rhizobium]QFY63493.1 hypothetical protein FZ934_24915 [Rhizobium grahamii]QRM51743.1 hypothetical protein F3Y33_20730 [Rhizobium sp. BG6]